MVEGQNGDEKGLGATLGGVGGAQDDDARNVEWRVFQKQIVVVCSLERGG